jgi:hypothetical protein
VFAVKVLAILPAPMRLWYRMEATGIPRSKVKASVGNGELVAGD